ncbi:MAG: hypothetical protein ACFFCW_01810 [Candidatus Hodarchaeota archaeon]
MSEEEKILSEAESIVQDKENAEHEITDEEIHGKAQDEQEQAAESSETEETEEKEQTERGEQAEQAGETEEYLDEIGWLKSHGIDDRFKSLDEVAEAVKRPREEPTNQIKELIEAIKGTSKESEKKTEAPPFYSVSETLRTAASKTGAELDSGSIQMAEIIDSINRANNKIILEQVMSLGQDLELLLNKTEKTEGYQRTHLYEIASRQLSGRIADKKALDDILKNNPTLLREDNPYFSAQLLTFKDPVKLREFVERLGQKPKLKPKIKTLSATGKTETEEPLGDLNKYSRDGRMTDEFRALPKEKQDKILKAITKEHGLDLSTLI